MDGAHKKHAMRYLTFIAFFISLTSLEAQKVYLHLDKPLYLPGETAFYAAHFPTSLTERSGVVQVSWFDPEGELVTNDYMQIKRVASGHFKIPYDASPGYYRLLITGQDVSNSTIKLLEAAVPIYSLDLVYDSSAGDSGVSFKEPSNSAETSPTEGVYQVRDSIVLKVPEYQGSMISMAVRDQHLFKGIDLPTLFSGTVDPNLRLVSSITLSGKADLPHDRQLLTFKMADQANFFYAITDSNGAFYLELPDFTSGKTIQFIKDFSDSQSVEFNEDQLSKWSGADPPLTPYIRSYIANKKHRISIYSLFNTVELAGSYESTTKSSTLDADLKIDASSYNLSDFRAFCKEVSTPLKYSKGSFAMFNPVVRDMRTGSPLFIVDGQLTRDHEFLAQLEFAGLQEILLFYDDISISDYFGFVGYNGVVVINSKLGNIQVPQAHSTVDFKVSGYLRPINFQQDSPAGTPVLRPMVYWGVLAKPTMTFQHTHDKGIFQADIVTVIDNKLHRHTVAYQVE